MTDGGKNPNGETLPVPVEKPKRARKPRKPKEPKKSKADYIADCLDFRQQGFSHEQIAQELGLKPSEVASYIEEGANQIIVEPKRVALLMELERVNQLMQKQYDAAINGETDATRAVMELTRRRIDLIKEIQELGSVDDNALALAAVPYAFAGLPRPAPPKKKKGRPGHVPTERSTIQVETLAVAGAGAGVIAQMLHIDTDTLRKHYQPVIDNARTRFAGEMLLLHATKARRGDSNAQQFLLRTVWNHVPGGNANAAGAGSDGAMPVDPRKLQGGNGEQRIVVLGGLPDPENPTWEDQLPELKEPEPLPDKKDEPAVPPLKAVQ